MPHVLASAIRIQRKRGRAIEQAYGRHAEGCDPVQGHRADCASNLATSRYTVV